MAIVAHPPLEGLEDGASEHQCIGQRKETQEHTESLKEENFLFKYFSCIL